MTDPKPLVLVVDDDASMRYSLRAVLEIDGLRVEEAGDGFAALELFETLQPDLVILDMIMPTLDGFHTCRAIRANPAGEDTPILVTTGLEDVATIERAYEAGATDFAIKPVNYLILRQRIHYMLRAARDHAELRASERRLRDAQRIARLGHWEWDAATDRVLMSDEARSILGLGPGSITSAMLVRTAAHGPGRESLERALTRAITCAESATVEHAVTGVDPNRVVCHAAVPIPHRDGVRGVSGTVQDITERKVAEERIARLAFFDGTTGLPNRAFLLRHVNGILARRETSTGALLSIDLDGFKRINDSLGHGAGDELLAEVGRRLGRSVRGADWVGRAKGSAGDPNEETVARFGGDEFIVVLPTLRTYEDAAGVAERILTELERPFVVGTNEVIVSASVGIATFNGDGVDVETLLKNADAAMYHAKASGRSRYEFYTDSLDASARARLAMEEDLRRVIERNQLEVHYQPKVDAATHEVLGFEALVRWRHPTRGLVPPLDFIPLAEDTGLIVPIGEWVLWTACNFARALQLRSGRDYHIAINVSSRQFRDAGFVGAVRRILTETAIDPGTVELEITEGTLMDATAGESLGALKDIGVHVAIDDFGTGYSSLSYLRRFPIDILKIDRSFVRDVVTDADSATIASAILALAHRLRLLVVAEGVETEAQLEFLQGHGCNEIQGYFFSPPLPSDRLQVWLDLKHTTEVAPSPTASAIEPVSDGKPRRTSTDAAE